ncbi:MAG TPA: hypothetical protein VFU86_16230 [Terriglobales bacterium]|nr:hypothetical protein [Terriglobales bacterium]
MRISRCLLAVLFLINLESIAQTTSAQPKILSTWTAYGRQFTTTLYSGPVKQTPSAQTISVLTPAFPITVRRIEAFSMLGPRQASLTQGVQEVSPAKPCPKQFFIIITNGAVTESVPMSGTFLSKAFETYTDSGDLHLPFPAGSRIILSILPPDIQPPALSCGAYDVTINVQYETIMPVQTKASDTKKGTE